MIFIWNVVKSLLLECGRVLVQNYANGYKCGGNHSSNYWDRRNSTAQLPRPQQEAHHHRDGLGHVLASLHRYLLLPLHALHHHHGQLQQGGQKLPGLKHHQRGRLHLANYASNCIHLQSQEQGL
jgi:hypothetical protein